MYKEFPNNEMAEQEPINIQDESQEEAMLLMSMALDNMLSAEEEWKFQSLLAQDQSLALLWEDWQRIDSRFSSIGRVMPPADFVQQVESRLAANESTQLWWSNLFVVIASLIIWGGMLAAALMLGYNAYTNQAALMSDFVRSLTGMAASLIQWLRALRIALVTLSGSPQTMGLLVGYLCASVAALLWWVHFLRNNTRWVEA